MFDGMQYSVLRRYRVHRTHYRIQYLGVVVGTQYGVWCGVLHGKRRVCLHFIPGAQTSPVAALPYRLWLYHQRRQTPHTSNQLCLFRTTLHSTYYHTPYTLPANKTTNQLEAFRNDQTPKSQRHDRRAPWLIYTSLPIHFPSPLRAESNIGTAYILQSPDDYHIKYQDIGHNQYKWLRQNNGQVMH